MTEPNPRNSASTVTQWQNHFWNEAVTKDNVWFHHYPFSYWPQGSGSDWPARPYPSNHPSIHRLGGHSQ